MNQPLTPLDGRYADKVAPLVPYLSEFALVKYRVMVEVEWLMYLKSVLNQPFRSEEVVFFDTIMTTFEEAQYEEIKEIETELRHDVKAVEVWLGRKLKENGYELLLPYIHFGRTSDDINNLAYACMVRDMRRDVLLPQMSKLQEQLVALARDYAEAPMLARTHGQPATPTTFGKECAVFASRLKMQINHVANVPIYGKGSGATGTFSADAVSYPDVDWPKTMRYFVESLKLGYNPITTQIEPHDWIARLNNEVSLFSTICTDVARDFWQYISLGYVVQQVETSEVGSSTMPHKVNPIDFENAEANFGLSSALLNHLSAKLPISRLQRDLSDSSAMRALSEGYGHLLVALLSLQKGLSKVSANPEKMLDDLRDEWSVLTEAVQMVMRKNGVVDAYDQMKSLARGKSVTKESLHAFIEALDIQEEDKQRLLSLTPEQYVGSARELARSEEIL